MLYTAELFARARCPEYSHQEPDFAAAILRSSRSDKEIIADLRTPPTTTTSAILHIKSCASSGVNFRPADCLTIATENLNRRSNGSGPDARPPNVFKRAPAGRTPDISQDGI